MQLCDELPDIGVHPEGEEEDAGQLAEQKQQTQMVDMNLLHTLREDVCVCVHWLKNYHRHVGIKLSEL